MEAWRLLERGAVVILRAQSTRTESLEVQQRSKALRSESLVLRRHVHALQEKTFVLREQIEATLKTSRNQTIEGKQLRPTRGRSVDANAVGESPNPLLDLLSVREREVLTLISRSYSTKQIAAALKIAFRTAVNHRTHIMSKLGIHDIAGLTRFAVASRLLQAATGE